MMKNINILLLFFLLISIPSKAQTSDPAYKKKVLEVVRIQGAQDFAINQAIEQMGKMVPEEKKKEFEREMKTQFEKLIDQTADIYLKNLSEKEIDALYEFYHSPVGKKIQKKMPVIMEESNEFSQQFAQQLMPLIQKYIQY